MTEYKQCRYSLRKAIKQAKCQYSNKADSQFNGSDTRSMWQGLQEITDYKKKTSHVTETDVTLPDKLNNFFARFEDNTVPQSRPANKDCVPLPLPFSMADARKTFKCVNPQKAAVPDGIPSRVLRACVAGVFTVRLQTFSTAPYPSLLSLHASRWLSFVPVPTKAKITELNDYRPGTQFCHR
jgi:hypothetical protein